MESIFDNLCRFCLRSGNASQSIFGSENKMSIVDKLTYCTMINVLENDGFPACICMQCLKCLQQCYQFIKMCKSSDKMLHLMQEPFLKMIHMKENPHSKGLHDKLALHELFEKVFQNYDHSVSSKLLERALDYSHELGFNFDFDIPLNIYYHDKINIDMDKIEQVIETEADPTKSPLIGDVKTIKTDCPVTATNITESLLKVNLPLIRNSARNIYKLSNDGKSKRLSKSHNCERCKHSLDTDEKLQQHKKSMHNCRYICLYCNRTFRSLSVRKQHMQLHQLQNETITCNFCNKNCLSQKALRAHKLTHTGVLKTSCHICHRLFSSPANMKRHMMIHLNQRPYMCHYCGMSFNQAGTRDTHIMVKHSPEKIHRCKMCTMRFETTELLQKHVSRHEQGDSNIHIITLTCTECNKSFATQANLKNHMNWHNKPFLCIVCGKGFASKHTLKNHEITHTGERPFACTFCEKTFTMKVLLKSHLKSHDDDNGKKFQCGYCPKKFALQSTLKTHTYIHTGERPFKCNVCGKTFNQNAHLRTHLFTHTGEKKHVCEICNKAFALKEGLRYHIMTHTGQTPFICSECGRGFYIQYKLKVHMLKSHNVEMNTKIKLK